MRKSYSCNYQKFQIKSQIIEFCKHQKQVSLQTTYAENLS